jgi:hypothetical protein
MLGCRKRLFAGRAGVHVDFHANRHFDDLGGLPGHFRSPSNRDDFLPLDKLIQFKKFASDYFAARGDVFCAAMQNEAARAAPRPSGKTKPPQ